MIKEGDRVMNLKDGATGHVILYDKSVEFYRVKMDYKSNNNYLNYRWFAQHALVKV